MKKFIGVFGVVMLLQQSCVACPTCVGLPRPGERPFFERPALMNIVIQAQQQKQTQSNQSKSMVQKT